MLLLALLLRPGAAWAQGSTDYIQWELQDSQLDIAWNAADRSVWPFCTATTVRPEDERETIKYYFKKKDASVPDDHAVLITATTRFPNADCDLVEYEVFASIENVTIYANQKARYTFRLQPKPRAVVTWSLRDDQLDVWGGTRLDDLTEQLHAITVTPASANSPQYLRYSLDQGANKKTASNLTFPKAADEAREVVVQAYVEIPSGAAVGFCASQQPASQTFRVRPLIRPTIVWDVPEEELTVEPNTLLRTIVSKHTPIVHDDIHPDAAHSSLAITYKVEIPGKTLTNQTDYNFGVGNETQDTQVKITASSTKNDLHTAASTSLTFTLPRKALCPITWELDEELLNVTPLAPFGPTLRTAEGPSGVTVNYRLKGKSVNINTSTYKFPVATEEDQSVTIVTYVAKNDKSKYRETYGPEKTFKIAALIKPVLTWDMPARTELRGGEKFESFMTAEVTDDAVIGYQQRTSSGTINYNATKSFPKALQDKDQEVVIEAYTVKTSTLSAATPVLKTFIVQRKATPTITWALTREQRLVEPLSLLEPLLTATVEPSTLELKYRFANRVPVSSEYQFPAQRDECQDVVVEAWTSAKDPWLGGSLKMLFHVKGKNHTDGDFAALTLPEADKATNDDPNAPCYDLLGRRLAQPPAKGLYIQNHRLKQAHKR